MLLVGLRCGVRRLSLSLNFSLLWLRLWAVVIAFAECLGSSDYVLSFIETLLSSRVEELEEVISRICTWSI